MKLALILAVLAIIVLLAILAIIVGNYSRQLAAAKDATAEWRNLTVIFRQQLADIIGVACTKVDDRIIPPEFESLLSRVRELVGIKREHEKCQRDLRGVSASEAYAKAQAYDRLFQVLCSSWHPDKAWREIERAVQTAEHWQQCMGQNDLQEALDAHARAQQLRTEVDDIERQNAQLQAVNAQLESRMRYAEALVNWFQARETVLQAHLVTTITGLALAAELIERTDNGENLRRLRQWISRQFFAWFRCLVYYRLSPGTENLTFILRRLERKPLQSTWVESEYSCDAMGDEALSLLAYWFSGAYGETKGRNPDEILVALEALPDFFEMPATGQVTWDQSQNSFWLMTGNRYYGDGGDHQFTLPPKP